MAAWLVDDSGTLFNIETALSIQPRILNGHAQIAVVWERAGEKVVASVKLDKDAPHAKADEQVVQDASTSLIHSLSDGKVIDALRILESAVVPYGDAKSAPSFLPFGQR